MDCLFCKIIAGEIPCYKVWESETHLAFLDIHPMREGHALVVPKAHASYVFDLDDPAYVELMRAAKTVATILKRTMSVPRVGVAVEGFSVDHVHVHLVPIDGVGQLDPCNAAKDVDHAALVAALAKIVNS
jgi:histidine triad (HIT) family protein